ncbi:unnamed protein product [Phytophthora lilii]|uniref:Unnamed protein product n=1 Tax=Phytophthora lilii TaxID=2077276 RepID=A0A9W6YEU6_9STRA|nr:unnamed protein product [Phytophthora lilii]
MYVSLGSRHRSGRGTKTSEEIRVVEIFKHPLFNETWLDYDVGLIKLETPATHQPAKLCAADGSNNPPGTMATVIGWGMVNNATFAQTLRSVDVEIISDDECTEYLVENYYNTSLKSYESSTSSVGSTSASAEVEVDWVGPTAMCAGRGDAKDSCFGDSGGPLIVKNDVIVGIVSSGQTEECGIVPGSYTRVSEFLPYINEIVKGGSSGNATDLLGGIHYREYTE